MKILKEIELLFGNVKFAVVIILIFAFYLGFGTFMESYHGTDYANRLVYKSYPFISLQTLMFISILIATLHRLPAKKNLYGFYVLHLGLLTLFIGSFVTYWAGVDGSMALNPNTAVKAITLNDDILKITIPKEEKEISVTLPYKSGESKLNLEYEDIKIKRYLPFAEDSLSWVHEKKLPSLSGRYRLFNNNFGENITLSLHPLSDFPSTTQLGLLSAHLLPTTLADCFVIKNNTNFLIWDGLTGECFVPKNIHTSNNVTTVKLEHKSYRFLTHLSPLPLNESGSLDETSSIKIFNKSLFSEKPHLFIFGNKVAFYDKEKKEWIQDSFDEKAEIPLPWMGFRLIKETVYSDKYPIFSPTYKTPIQENNQLITGNLKAIEIEFENESFWVKSNLPMKFSSQKIGTVNFELTKKTIPLNFELILDKFKMDKDPGTNNPASFESFVTLFQGTGKSQKHHIFMNNPLKHADYTFYQASYYEVSQGNYGSVLSVNFDPGRWIKYLGSFLFVFGSIWHYVLRRKKNKISSH
jgi:hypothetical protein